MELLRTPPITIGGENQLQRPRLQVGVLEGRSHQRYVGVGVLGQAIGPLVSGGVVVLWPRAPIEPGESDVLGSGKEGSEESGDEVVSRGTSSVGEEASRDPGLLYLGEGGRGQIAMGMNRELMHKQPAEDETHAEKGRQGRDRWTDGKSTPRSLARIQILNQ